MEKRETFIEEIQELFREFYRSIAGQEENAFLRYRSRISEKDRSRSSLRMLSAMPWKRAFPKSSGGEQPCLDPIGMTWNSVLNDKPLKHHGSQGQQRSFILALKMAEIEYLRKRWGNPPVLLLDDMTSELDRNETAI